MIIDTTTAPAGPRHFDPATERHQPDGGRAFRCGIRETSYPSGCSSSSGPIAVRTPFGEAVVHQSSFCGATVFAPLDSPSPPAQAERASPIRSTPTMTHPTLPHDPTLSRLLSALDPTTRAAVDLAIPVAISGARGALKGAMAATGANTVELEPDTTRRFYHCLARALTLAAEQPPLVPTSFADPPDANPLAQPVSLAGALTPDSPRGIHPVHGPVYHDGRAWRHVGDPGAVGALVPVDLVVDIVLTAREALRVRVAEREAIQLEPPK